MFGLDESVVDSLIATYRQEAEQSVASVQAALATRKDDLARVVAGFRSVLFAALNRAIQLNIALVGALQKDPNNVALATAQRRVIRVIEAGTALAQGYAAYERPADEAEAAQAVRVGIAPAVVLVVAIGGVAVVALSVMGVAWAIVHFEQAKTLEHELDLVQADPSVAGALAELNRSKGAADSGSGPDLPKPPGDGMGTGIAVALGLLAAGGAAVWWMNSRRK